MLWTVNDALIFTLNILVRLSHNHGKMQNTGRSYFAFEYSLCVGQKRRNWLTLSHSFEERSVFIFKLKLSNIKEIALFETSGSITQTK
jgi:hypothetical protein